MRFLILTMAALIAIPATANAADETSAQLAWNLMEDAYDDYVTAYNDQVAAKSAASASQTYFRDIYGDSFYPGLDTPNTVLQAVLDGNAEIAAGVQDLVGWCGAGTWGFYGGTGPLTDHDYSRGTIVLFTSDPIEYWIGNGHGTLINIQAGQKHTLAEQYFGWEWWGDAEEFFENAEYGYGRCEDACLAADAHFEAASVIYNSIPGLWFDEYGASPGTPPGGGGGGGMPPGP